MFTPSDGLNLSEVPDVESSLSSLLLRFHANDPAAAEDLGQFLLPGLRLVIRRRVNAQDVDDVLQDTLVDVLSAIRHRTLHDSEALAGFARTIALRKCAACITGLVSNRARGSGTTDVTIATTASRHPSPESSAMESEKIQLVRAVLSWLLPRDREILQRFYVEEESQEHICSEMRLSPTQFRLLKSRAKAKFGNLGRARRHTQAPLEVQNDRRYLQ